MATLLLTRSEVERLVDPAALVADLSAAFRAYSTTPGLRAQRVRSSLNDRGSATVLFPGTVAGIPAYTVKVHAKFPDQRPAIRGVLCLHDAHTGDLLAVMDSTHLTAVRTGLAGALAADVLARAGAETVAVVGAGMQGEHQLRSLAMLRPLSRVWAYDTRPEQAQAFAARMAAELRIAVEPSASLEVAVREADIILAATWARTPFLFLPMLRQGVHVTTLGADEPGKCEVAAEVMREAVVVCDDRDLAVRMGAVGGAGLGPEVIDAELGEVLAGVHPGRTSPSEMTVFGGVGLAFQDLVVAWEVYRLASTRRAGRAMDFLA
ncbi:MAG TPA: ornithine cyclodeaminase family protein [Candidatus Binatia bacterium]|nr:ornithine cyclodeaminase family protein [Candidatus Binatia bacterium]